MQLPIHNNFDFYSINEFHTSLEIQNLKGHNYFKFLHINLKSLSANFDNSLVMLEELQFPFSIMGLSETKIENNNICLLNTNLFVYNFVSQTTVSNVGGVGLYVRENLKYILRHDLSLSDETFQGLWIEVETSDRKLICEVVYRHPRNQIDSFVNYSYQCLDKIQQENKICVIMGDFNINLNNYTSHASTKNFVNTICSYFYSPYIFLNQPE